MESSGDAPCATRTCHHAGSATRGLERRTRGRDPHLAGERRWRGRARRRRETRCRDGHVLWCADRVAKSIAAARRSESAATCRWPTEARDKESVAAWAAPSARAVAARAHVVALRVSARFATPSSPAAAVTTSAFARRWRRSCSISRAWMSRARTRRRCRCEERSRTLVKTAASALRHCLHFAARKRPSTRPVRLDATSPARRPAARAESEGRRRRARRLVLAHDGSSERAHRCRHLVINGRKGARAPTCSAPPPPRASPPRRLEPSDEARERHARSSRGIWLKASLDVVRRRPQARCPCAARRLITSAASATIGAERWLRRARLWKAKVTASRVTRMVVRWLRRSHDDAWDTRSRPRRKMRVLGAVWQG